MTAPAKTAGGKARPKIDFGAEFDNANEEAAQQAADRFAIGAAAVKHQPSALQPASPASSAPAAEAGQGGPASVPLRATSGQAFDIGALVVGRTYDVPLNMVDPNPYSPRYFYKSAQVDKTAMSMEQKGQKVPANGFVTDKGRVQLIEGGTRLRSARAIGAATLEVKIEEAPKSDLELYNRAVEFHDERTNHTALDTAMLMRKLLDEGVCATQDELTTKVKVNGAFPSKQTVSTYLRISRNVPERLLLQMADHEATSVLRVAFAISGIFTHPDREKDSDRFERIAEEVIQEVISKDLGVKDVEALIASKLQGPKQRQRGESTNIKFGEAKGVIKTFEARGQLDFSIKGMDPQKLGALKEHIEGVCAGRINLGQAA